MALDAFAELEEGAVQSLEGAEVGVGKAIGDEAADATGGLDEQDPFAALGRRDRSRDARGRGAVNQHVILLGAERVDEQADQGQQGEEEPAHPQAAIRCGTNGQAGDSI
jgi:hypothetical protein